MLATIVHQAGPSPRGVGAKCIILEDGSFLGTVGGGVLESRTLGQAGTVFRTRQPLRLHFDLRGEDVAKTDMLCGGQVEVFLEPCFPGDPIQSDVMQRISEISRRGGSGVLATVLNEGAWLKDTCPKALLEKEGRITGAIYKPLEAALLQGLMGFIERRQPAGLSLEIPGLGPVDLFIEPIVSSPVLYVFGAGHVSKQIVPLAVKVGFDVVVIDDRPDFADPQHFPEAGQVMSLPFQDVMHRLTVDARSFIVIVTRGHLHDKEVLSQALRTQALYIGMIGSRRKKDMIYARLREEGFAPGDLGPGAFTHRPEHWG